MRSLNLGLVAAVIAMSSVAPPSATAESQDSSARAVTRTLRLEPSDSAYVGIVAIPEAVTLARNSMSVVHAPRPMPSRNEHRTSFPPELALAALATARKSARKSAKKTADKRSGIPTPAGGTTAGPPTETVVEPAAGSPLAKKAIERQRDEANKRASAIQKEAKKAAAHRTPVIPPVLPPDPDDSDNIAETGKFDETVGGGRYQFADGKFRNAHGEIVK